MTVAALPSTASYLEDGVTVAFAAPFRFKAATDLIVERIAAGVAVPLTIGADYAVTGGATDAGGTVTRNVATAGATLRIRRSTALAQPMVYTTGDRFPAKSHEEALDRQMLIAQEQGDGLEDLSSRALALPAGERQGVLPPAAARVGGNKILAPDPVTGQIIVADGGAFRGAPGGNIMAVGLFAAAAGMVIPAGTQVVRTSGWDMVGYGIADYQEDLTLASGYVAANPYTSFLTADGRVFRLPRGNVSVAATGGSPTALSSAASAFQRALQAARDTPSHFDPLGVGINPAVILPPGTYSAAQIRHSVYTDVTSVNPSGTSNLIIRAEVPGTVSIINTANDYLLTIDGRYSSVDFDGICVQGGGGLVHFTNPGNNVNRFARFSRCLLFGHSNVGIGNEASDAPYLRVEGCYFGGLPGAIDIAWGGYIDGSIVDGCVFDGASINLKLGPRVSGSFHVQRNDFHKNRGDYTKTAALWLQPNTEDNTGASAGTGAVISGNKFGNEYQNRYEAPILLANALPQAQGADRAPLMPDLTNIAGILAGLTFQDNTFECLSIPGGNEGNDAPIMRASLTDVRNLTWRNNKTDGPRWQRLCEFLVPANPYSLFVQQNWTVDLDGSERYQFGISNRPIGRARDRHGVAASPTVAQPSDVRSDDDVILFNGADPTVASKVGGATVVAGVGDRYGGDYGLVTFAAINDAIVLPFTMIDLTGSPAWFSVDLAPVADGTRAIREVYVEVFNGNVVVRREVATINTALQRSVKVVLNWEMPTVPAGTDPRAWAVRIRPNVLVGQQNQFLYGNALANVGALPANPAHLRTSGSAWNRPHLVLGDWHLWVDDTVPGGKLRLKLGSPTSAIDGAIA